MYKKKDFDEAISQLRQNNATALHKAIAAALDLYESHGVVPTLEELRVITSGDLSALFGLVESKSVGRLSLAYSFIKSCFEHHKLTLMHSALKSRSYFPSVAQYFKYLSHPDHNEMDDFFYLLMRSPELVSAQDEQGNTLLHAIVDSLAPYSPGNVFKLLSLVYVFQPSFTLKDNEGYTALHRLAQRSHSYDQQTFVVGRVLESMVAQALEQKAVLSVRCPAGCTFLHTLLITCPNPLPYTHPGPRDYEAHKTRNALRPVLTEGVVSLMCDAADPSIHCLSRSGSTALFYAINHQHYASALALVRAGVNPELAGQPDRNPLREIESMLSVLAKAQVDVDQDDDCHFVATYFEEVSLVAELRAAMTAAARNHQIERAEGVRFFTAHLGEHDHKAWSELKLKAGDKDRCGPGYGF
ncbi:MAG: hypothetical protein COV52_08090 [Gammaproteobacteria bacterium CG11_big_fil_rev_8_21_14_0_20_46_22]|nr:MAG: hypothetical protein COW05_00030 [Gammaproteobacteria bacterium CG12_big_fil_rev_8_21_14_0_65_46_12]PIR10623.1 MAG: hypothetical protein COV52_08090 [Gammaproteobacteria bacterium CG11_big_fil_rev_8_21_14_0_20_46_22]